MKVTIPLLDREYSFNCTEEKQEELYKCAAELQSVCANIQNKNPRASVDKVLVTAALNLIAQLSAHRVDMEDLSVQIEHLKSKVELLD